MPRYLLALAIFALAIYSVSDVIASTDQRRNNTPKFLWILITLFIPILGPIIWIVFSNANKQKMNSSAPTGPLPYKPRPKTRADGTLAPDDDPDFLWKLQAEQRRKEAEEKRKKQENDGDTPAS